MTTFFCRNCRRPQPAINVRDWPGVGQIGECAVCANSQTVEVDEDADTDPAPPPESDRDAATLLRSDVSLAMLVADVESRYSAELDNRELEDR